MDYIIRDATTIGFKNAQVDYYRLLKGLRILKQKIPESKYTYHIGYHKSALSVIESAIYAHDAEKKWIQSHPAILYEMVALKSAMAKLTGLFTTTEDKNPLFCYESLTEAGKKLFWDEPLLSQEANELLKNNCLLTPQAQALLLNMRDEIQLLIRHFLQNIKHSCSMHSYGAHQTGMLFEKCAQHLARES